MGEGGGQGREGAGTATPDASEALEAWTRGMAERQRKTDRIPVISPQFCLWASRDEMWGSSLRWEMLAEDQDGAGFEFRGERNKDFF